MVAQDGPRTISEARGAERLMENVAGHGGAPGAAGGGGVVGVAHSHEEERGVEVAEAEAVR